VPLVALRYGRFIEYFVTGRHSEVLPLKVVGRVSPIAGMAGHLQVSAAVGAFLFGIARHTMRCRPELARSPHPYRCQALITLLPTCDNAYLLAGGRYPALVEP
jgi:hypothetical protein